MSPVAETPRHGDIVADKEITIYAKKPPIKKNSSSKNYISKNFISNFANFRKNIPHLQKSALENSAFPQPTAKIGASFADSSETMYSCNQL